jgi:hypothetical protein
MSFHRTSALLVWVAAYLLPQSCPGSPSTPDPSQPVLPQPAAAPTPEPPSQLARIDDALVAPIALYPDALVALILPASTVPADLIAASEYLVQYGDATRIARRPWDPSVKALAHYPKVIAWMAENIPWTQALGHAFMSSPSDVMDAVQRMRARALAAGALVSTPQQQVYADAGEIEIYPGQPDSVYVPVYDDSVVYSDDSYYGYVGPFLNFGEAYPAGAWLSYYFDWRRHRLWAGDPYVWRERIGWQPPRTGGDRAPPGAHPWLSPVPSPAPGTLPSATLPGNSAPVPRPMSGAPSAPPDSFRRPAGALGLTGTGVSPLPMPGVAAPQLPQPLPVAPSRTASLPPAPPRSPEASPPHSGNSQPQK